MPAIPTDAAAVETLVRGLLETKFTGITGLPNVYAHRLFIENKPEAGRVMGYKHPSTNRTEHRVLLIDYNRREDTDDGCVDDPVYFLIYTLKLVVEHMDARNGDATSTSTDDYARFSLTIHTRVIGDRSCGGYGQLYCENPVPAPTVYGMDDETLIYGHIGTFEQRVEVRPA